MKNIHNKKTKIVESLLKENATCLSFRVNRHMAVNIILPGGKVK